VLRRGRNLRETSQLHLLLSIPSSLLLLSRLTTHNCCCVGYPGSLARTSVFGFKKKIILAVDCGKG
jgi:hypothetical protein